MENGANNGNIMNTYLLKRQINADSATSIFQFLPKSE